MNQKMNKINSATNRIYQKMYWSKANNRDKEEEAVQKLEKPRMEYSQKYS